MKDVYVTAICPRGADKLFLMILILLNLFPEPLDDCQQSDCLKSGINLSNLYFN